MRIQPNPTPPRTLALEPGRQRFLSQDGRVFRFPTDGSIFSLGSDEKCAVRWTGPNVQPFHAQGKWESDRLWVRKDGGQTLVNGQATAADEWTPIRPGQHLQLGEIQDKSLGLAVLGQRDVSGPTSEQPLAITFFGDASVPDISKDVAGQPERFERIIGKTGAPVKVNGLVANGGKLGDLVHTAMPVVMGAVSLTGVATAATACVQAVMGSPLSVPMLVLGGLLGATGGLMTAVTWNTSGEHLAAFKQKLSQPLQPENWKHVRHSVVSQGPRQEQLAGLWRENLSGWPGSRQVVYLSGHGFQDRAAGLRFEALAETVQGAEAIVLDACNGGQVEALSRLTGSARVAVVSEDTVRGFGFPIESMFGHGQFPADPREFGIELLRRSAWGRAAKSMVAVDLQALQKKLLPGLDRLGRSLSRLSQAGHGEALKACLNHSETTDADQYGGTVDLGSFLDQLQQNPTLAARCPELARTRQAFNETILCMLGHGTLSFDRRPPAHLPEGWRQFLRDHRK